MSIISPPGYGHPDWQSLDSLWGPTLINFVGTLTANEIKTFPLTSIAGYRYLTGYIALQDAVGSFQLNWYSDANEDVNSGSTAFGLGKDAANFAYPHMPNQGPYFNLEVINTTATLSPFVCQLGGSNVPGNVPFNYEGGLLLRGVSPSDTTYTFTVNGAYGGAAMLYTQAANGAVTEVDYLDPISGDLDTLWTNKPGSTNADWTKDVLYLPGGGYSITMTTATASVMYCNLAPVPSIVG